MESVSPAGSGSNAMTAAPDNGWSIPLTDSNGLSQLTDCRHVLAAIRALDLQ
jgi:hypothetical protein